jgi:hypothetical protein
MELPLDAQGSGSRLDIDEHVEQCRAVADVLSRPRAVRHSALDATLSGTIIRGTLKAPNSQLVTPSA